MEVAIKGFIEAAAVEAAAHGDLIKRPGERYREKKDSICHVPL